MKFDFLKNSHWSPMPVTDAFERTILRENFSRMRVLSVLLLMTELVIYMFRDMFFKIGTVLTAFIVMSLVMIPIIWLTYEYLDKISTDLAKLVQYIYAFGIISFGSGLSFAAAAEADLVHMYFMTVFGVLITVYMKPAESFLLLLVSYLTFTLLLPFYQENDTTVLVTRINSMIFTTFAWSQSRLQFNVRHRQYLDQATIQNKNLILEESVRRDAMTGLLNHSYSIETLEEAIKTADLHGSALSLIMADIDDLGTINERFGYRSGDEVISKIAAIIRESVRPEDTVGRYGGGTFILILNGADREMAVSIAGKIIAGCSVADFPDNIWVTISSGISTYNGETLPSLIRKTDEQMRRAKQNGKNRIEIN